MKKIVCSLTLMLSCLHALASIPPIGADGRVFSLSPMLEKVTPAVVNISVQTANPMSQNPLFNDPFFRQFFGDLEGLGEGRPSQSAGSGVIIDDKRGIIVTNHHVISRARAIQVTLKNRKTYNAQLIGIDSATDLAVIAIKPDNPNELTAIKLGNSEKVEVGDFVVAIGNPFAIGQTVTSGIVSALGRSGLNIKNFEDFIQTDAAINPGNSGGALVNLSGELIGINSSIISPAGASVGIGFAIPVNMMKNVTDQIIKNGRVERGSFGVEITDLSDELAQSLGIALRDGAVIARVLPNTMAQKAGLEAGDVVIELGGIAIRSANHLRSQLALIPPGTAMQLRVIRGGRTLRINSEMGGARDGARRAQPSSRPTPNNRAPTERNNPPDGNGRAQAGWELQEQNGKVVVQAINRGGLAAQWGVEAGDVLITINGQEINALADVPERFSSSIDISVLRGSALLRIIRR